MSQPDYAIYALTRQGLDLALSLADRLAAHVYLPQSLNDAAGPDRTDRVVFSSLPETLRASFRRYRCHVFITAAGIAVRCIAPLLGGKERDPAVLVIDQNGRHVVSLLSGHLGGANEQARRLAGLIGARPVITTATDCQHLPALDLLARQHGMAIPDLAALRDISSALLDGRPVTLHDPSDHLGMLSGPWRSLFHFSDDLPRALAAPGPTLIVTHLAPPAPGRCFLHPRIVHAGVGCRRGADGGDVIAAIRARFLSCGMSLHSLCSLGSLDIKASEPGLLEAAAFFSVPLRVFSREALGAFSLERPSARVRDLVGVAGVCEAAAQASAASCGPHRLVGPKEIHQGVAVALAVPSG